MSWLFARQPYSAQTAIVKRVGSFWSVPTRQARRVPGTSRARAIISVAFRLRIPALTISQGGSQMRSWHIVLTVLLALVVGVAPALAQTTAPGSSPSPSTQPNVGPGMPGDTKPTTPGIPAAPRLPGTSAPSASPSMTGSVPAAKSDCAGGGWS
jgi:hypothetical protein